MHWYIMSVFCDLHVVLGFCSQLEEVMETETYKNAKLILERFDPEAKKKAVSAAFLVLTVFSKTVVLCVDFVVL